MPTTYLDVLEKRNKLCLFWWLNFLNFSSLDKLVSRKKCRHRNEILFISLTDILAYSSTEVKQEEESGSAAKKPKLDAIGEPGTSGVSNTSKTRKFKGEDKRKTTFLVN